MSRGASTVLIEALDLGEPGLTADDGYVSVSQEGVAQAFVSNRPEGSNFKVVWPIGRGLTCHAYFSAGSQTASLVIKASL